MGRILQISMTVCVVLVFASSAWSLTVPGPIDVGAADTFWVASSSVGNSDADELAWAIDQSGDSDLVSLGKIQGSAMQWIETNQSGTWAISFGTLEPEYFLIKTGNVAPPGSVLQYHILFENVDSMNWGVVNLSALDLEGAEIIGLDVGKISHVNPFGEVPVPEPTTMLLLGFGLIGLAGVRRLRK